MMFPTRVQNQTWVLTRPQLLAWQETYPAIDVEGELGKALAWIDADPQRRKTVRGMPRFLVGWLNRASERPRQAVVGEQPGFRGWTCPHVDRCDNRHVCGNKLIVGTVKYPLKKAEAS